MLTRHAARRCTGPITASRLVTNPGLDPVASTPALIGGVTLVAGAFVAGLNHCFS